MLDSGSFFEKTNSTKFLFFSIFFPLGLIKIVSIQLHFSHKIFTSHKLDFISEISKFELS